MFSGYCFQIHLGSGEHWFCNTFLRSVIQLFRLLFPNTFRVWKTSIFKQNPKNCNWLYKKLNKLPRWASFFFGYCFQTHLGSRKHRCSNMVLRTMFHRIKTAQINSMSQLLRLLFPTHIWGLENIDFLIHNSTRWANCFLRLFPNTSML